MKTNILFSAIILLGAIRCSNPQPSGNSQKITTLHVDINNPKEGKASTFFSDKSIIPLETTDESLIKYIDKLVLLNGKMYIFDKTQKTVFVFDAEGKFLHKISNIGKGPGEYEQIQDFCIDTLENKIILIADRPYKMLFYTMDGKFVNEKEMTGWYNNILTTPSNIVIYNRSNSQEKYKILFQSRKTGEINNFLPYSGKIPSTNIAFPNFCRSYATYFYEVLNDTIYKITDSAIKPAFYIDFGKDKLPENLRKCSDYNQIFREVVNTNKYGYFISNFRETEKYIIFKFEPDRKVFYSKADKKIMVLRTIFDDKTGLPIYYFAHDGKDNKFISIIEAGNFCSFLRLPADLYAKTYPEFPKVKSQFGNVKKTDNPIIVIYTLK